MSGPSAEKNKRQACNGKIGTRIDIYRIEKEAWLAGVEEETEQGALRYTYLGHIYIYIVSPN